MTTSNEWPGVDMASFQHELFSMPDEARALALALTQCSEVGNLAVDPDALPQLTLMIKNNPLILIEYDGVGRLPIHRAAHYVKACSTLECLSVIHGVSREHMKAFKRSRFDGLMIREKEGEVSFLEVRSDQNITGKHHTPLFVAATSGAVENVKLLIRLGANVNVTIVQHQLAGVSLIHDLCLHDSDHRQELMRGQMYDCDEKKFTRIIRLLVEGGANVNAKDESGRTAISDAAMGGNMHMVLALASFGADVNNRDTGATTVNAGMEFDHSGMTPLLNAMEYTHGNNEIGVEMVRTLIQDLGADPKHHVHIRRGSKKCKTNAMAYAQSVEMHLGRTGFVQILTSLQASLF